MTSYNGLSINMISCILRMENGKPHTLDKSNCIQNVKLANKRHLPKKQQLKTSFWFRSKRTAPYPLHILYLPILSTQKPSRVAYRIMKSPCLLGCIYSCLFFTLSIPHNAIRQRLEGPFCSPSRYRVGTRSKCTEN